MREYMLALTGSDYGLPVTFQPWRAEPATEAPVRLRPKVVRQPWDVRPARPGCMTRLAWALAVTSLAMLAATIIAFAELATGKEFEDLFPRGWFT